MNEACSLIAEAADPDANIIFGSVIDPHAGDEVRITVIATGFQTRDAVQPGPTMGRSMVGARGRADQMALPMQATAASVGQMPVASAVPPASMPGWAQPTTVASVPPRGYAVAPGRQFEGAQAEPIYDEFYDNMEQVPAGPIATTQAPTAPGGFGIAPAAEWTPAERPIIRPPVAAAGASASPGGPPPRRMSSQVASRPADELGVEESEFDKPTYLRRGIFAPE
jgi:cell division protein FtsZ